MDKKDFRKRKQVQVDEEDKENQGIFGIQKKFRESHPFPPKRKQGQVHEERGKKRKIQSTIENSWSKRAGMVNNSHGNNGQEIYDLDSNQFLQNLVKTPTIIRIKLYDDNESNDNEDDDDDDSHIEDTDQNQMPAQKGSSRIKLYDDNESNDDEDDDDDDSHIEDTDQNQMPAQKGSSSESKRAGIENSFAQDSNRVLSVTFKEDDEHTCETSGRETIRNMLEKHLKKHLSLKFNTENMVFKRASDGCAINLGLPTDVLDDDEYICTSHNQDKLGTKADYSKMRAFNVVNYKPSWNMGQFYIKVDRGRSSQPAIGGLKNVAEKIRIDFLHNETLFEAIVRDGRLKVKKEWYLKRNGKQIFLENHAHCYKGDCFTLHYKRNPNCNLPDCVQPLPEPEYNGAVNVPVMKSGSNIITPIKPGNSYQDDDHKETESPESADSPSKTILIKLSCNEDFRRFIKETYYFDIEKKETQKEEKKRLSNISKLFNTNEFALNYKHQIATSDLKPLSVLSDSVGAVVVELYGGVEEFMGTCFVIGSKYIITNNHVLDNTINTYGFKSFYIDFNFGNRGYKYRFYQRPVASSSKDGELDYAILELHDSCEETLPPTLTSCGFVIPRYDRPLDNGMCLTLVGHPGGQKKSVDMTCPVKHPDNLSKNTLLSLGRQKPKDFRVLHDKRRQTYDTTSFFYGSSGSPGVLLQRRLLVALHCRGFHLKDPDDSVIEQGIKMSAILADVNNKISSGVLPGKTLKDIFDYDYESEPMEIE